MLRFMLLWGLIRSGRLMYKEQSARLSETRRSHAPDRNFVQADQGQRENNLAECVWRSENRRDGEEPENRIAPYPNQRIGGNQPNMRDPYQNNGQRDYRHKKNVGVGEHGIPPHERSRLRFTFPAPKSPASSFGFANSTVPTHLVDKPLGYLAKDGKLRFPSYEIL